MYELKHRKPAVVFEIFLPRKDSYNAKLSEVMDSFLSEESILNIPEVKDFLSRHPEGSEQRHQYARRIKEFVTGYSLYEIKGRFMAASGPVDEDAWVIRLIMHDPEGPESIGPHFRKIAEAIVEMLIGKRFADELNSEDEIWMLEYHQPSLMRWIKET